MASDGILPIAHAHSTPNGVAESDGAQNVDQVHAVSQVVPMDDLPSSTDQSNVHMKAAPMAMDIDGADSNTAPPAGAAATDVVSTASGADLKLEADDRTPAPHAASSTSVPPAITDPVQSDSAPQAPISSEAPKVAVNGATAMDSSSDSDFVEEISAPPTVAARSPNGSPVKASKPVASDAHTVPAAGTVSAASTAAGDGAAKPEPQSAEPMDDSAVASKAEVIDVTATPSRRSSRRPRTPANAGGAAADDNAAPVSLFSGATPLIEWPVRNPPPQKWISHPPRGLEGPVRTCGLHSEMTTAS